MKLPIIGFICLVAFISLMIGLQATIKTKKPINRKLNQDTSYVR